MRDDHTRKIGRRRTASLITRSFFSSRWLLASSSSRMRGARWSVRASTMRCICPQESELRIALQRLIAPWAGARSRSVWRQILPPLISRFRSGSAELNLVILQYAPDLGTVRLKSLPFCNLEKIPPDAAAVGREGPCFRASSHKALLMLRSEHGRCCRRSW